MNRVGKIILTLAFIMIITGVSLCVYRNEKELNDDKLNNNMIFDDDVKNIGGSSNAIVDLSEKKYTGSKQNITIATVGHEYYDKSNLTSAITKFYGKYIATDSIVSVPLITKNNIKLHHL